MVVYNFKKIETVPTADALIDAILSKTQRKTPTVVHPNYNIVRIRQFYMRKVKFTQSCASPQPLSRGPVGVDPVSQLTPCVARRSQELPGAADADRDRLPAARGHPPVLRRPGQRALRPRSLQAGARPGEHRAAAHRLRGQGLRQAAEVRRLALPLQVPQARRARSDVHCDQAAEGGARVPGAGAASPSPHSVQGSRQPPQPLQAERGQHAVPPWPNPWERSSPRPQPQP